MKNGSPVSPSRAAGPEVFVTKRVNLASRMILLVMFVNFSFTTRFA